MHAESAVLRASILMRAPEWMVRSRAVMMPIIWFGEVSFTEKSASPGLSWPWSFACWPATMTWFVPSGATTRILTSFVFAKCSHCEKPMRPS